MSIVEKVQKRRLPYCGHIIRMNKERYPNIFCIEKSMKPDQEDDLERSGSTTSRKEKLLGDETITSRRTDLHPTETKLMDMLSTRVDYVFVDRTLSQIWPKCSKSVQKNSSSKAGQLIIL